MALLLLALLLTANATDSADTKPPLSAEAALPAAEIESTLSAEAALAAIAAADATNTADSEAALVANVTALNVLALTAVS